VEGGGGWGVYLCIVSMDFEAFLSFHLVRSNTYDVAKSVLLFVYSKNQSIYFQSEIFILFGSEFVYLKTAFFKVFVLLAGLLLCFLLHAG
jgi:hypothetical protein